VGTGNGSSDTLAAMELYDLEHGLGSIASTGCVLNCQDLVGLKAGLMLLKTREKFPEIFFWGKILGQELDFYVAYGMRESEFEFPSKQFFYAGEEFEFKTLPRLTEELADRVIEVLTEKDMPFTGKVEQLLEPPAEDAEPPPDDDAEAQVADKPKPLTELERLSQVVQEIDFDTAAVPAGAYCLNEAHLVVRSSNFRGLGATEATVLEKYVHFRPPTSVAALRALARSDVQFYSSFLDPLEDLPRGCWAVRQDFSATLVTLRSLTWPGYCAFHVPGTLKFGGAYIGYAQKNSDLPFLL